MGDLDGEALVYWLAFQPFRCKGRRCCKTVHDNANYIMAITITNSTAPLPAIISTTTTTTNTTITTITTVLLQQLLQQQPPSPKQLLLRTLTNATSYKDVIISARIVTDSAATSEGLEFCIHDHAIRIYFDLQLHDISTGRCAHKAWKFIVFKFHLIIIVHKYISRK